MVLAVWTPIGEGRADSVKPRVVVMTDIGADPDDTQSMVRFLSMSNDFDIEGLLATTSTWQSTPRPDLITSLVNTYGNVRANLALHDPGFPTKDYLLSCVKTGGAFGSDPYSEIGSGKDTEASNWIITVVDRADSRPVWITIWGGARELAQAVWKVSQTRTSAQLAAFKSKIRVHAIADQDDTNSWLRTNHPDLFYIKDLLVFRGMYLNGDTSYCSSTWVNTNIRVNHGALGAAYPDYPGMKEGDTPSFLYVVPNGLSDPQQPTWGCWGGRFSGSGTQYADTQDTYGGETSERATVWRWRPAYQNEFAARMDWCVQPYSGANHAPIAVFVGDLQQTVAAGAIVNLSAAGSSDPDGNALSYNWYHYVEPSSYKDALTIQNANSQQASFVAPAVSSQKTIHIILTVKDNGAPPLSRYKRIIFTVTPDTTPPSVPTNVQAVGEASTTIRVTWAASTDNAGVTGYKVYRNGAQVGTSTTTSYLDTGLSATTSYSYTVSSYDAVGNNSAHSSPPAIGTTLAPDSTPPSVPTNVHASGMSSSSIRADWTACTDNRGVLGYKVRRNGTQVGTTGATSYTDTGLAAGTTYSYTVSAYDGDGNDSAQSSPPAAATTWSAISITNVVPSNYVVTTFNVGTLTFIDRDYTITSMPTRHQGRLGIRTANGDKDKTSLDFRFTVNQPVEVYLCMQDPMQPTTPLLTGFTGTGENLQTSDVGTKTYNIFRKTYPAGQVNLGPKPGAGDGKSMYFVLVGYPEDAQAPSVPTSVQATALSQTSIQVTWTASTDNVGVAGYKVSRNGSQVGTSGTTSYTDGGLSPWTVYSYTVSAYDAAGNNSAQSSPAATARTLDTTAPSIPTNVMATAQTPKMVKITWSASTDNVGITGYKVYRNGSQVGTSTTSNYTDTGLSPNSAYSYSVSAYDAAGNNSAQSSPPVTVTTMTAVDIASAKQLAGSSIVGMISKTVTAIYDGFIYIEESDRYAGIKVVPVEMPAGLATGQTVDVGGTIETADGERYITGATVAVR